MTVQVAHFPLRGGLDLQSPMLQVDPGTAALMMNFEVARTGGYERAGGYERFDGQDAPSSTNLDDLREQFREAIQPVPGSGPVRGVAVYQGRVYAFRDKDQGAGGGPPAAGAYVSSSDGWKEITVPAGHVGGGRYELVVHNFTGDPGDQAIYGVDGVNSPFEIKDETFSEITVAGMSGQAPEHIAAHKNHLFISYPGGSVQHSGIGDPTDWNASTGGAGEIAQGDEVTGLMPVMDDALAIFSRNTTRILYGASGADWEQKGVGLQSDGAGALPYTMARMGEPLFVDDIGLRSLSAVNAYGNFSTGTLSFNVEPVLARMRSDIAAAVALRDKSQYRVFTKGGQALCLTIAGKEPLGYGLCQYPASPSCADSGESDEGDELAVIGTANGYVYRLERGNTYDGEPIPSSLRLNFHIAQSPTTQKRWRRAVIDVTTPAEVDIFCQAAFNFGHPDVAVARVTELEGVARSGGVWDVDDWGEFLWDGQHLAEAITDIVGSGHSIALTLYSQSEHHTPPFTLNGVVLHYSPRRLNR